MEILLDHVTDLKPEHHKIWEATQSRVMETSDPMQEVQIRQLEASGWRFVMHNVESRISRSFLHHLVK